LDSRQFNVKLFCDSASLRDMQEMLDSGLARGATCNPSLCRRAGVSDYVAFCREASQLWGSCPLSLEVVADDVSEITRQAHVLADLGPNVFVKVPIVDSRGASNIPLIASLSDDGLRLNVTCMFTGRHVFQAMDILRQSPERPGFISLFCGRVADAGHDPCPTVRLAVEATHGTTTEVIWASVREPLNIVQAANCGCHVVTAFPEVLRRISRFGRDLDEFATETSKMFYDDAKAAGYTL
jgi:transaldolase